MLRYEIKDLTPPNEILRAMQAQITAEREKRALIAASEGRRQEQINIATGEREAFIARSEGEKQAAINKAQGEAAAITTVADATAQALERVASAIQQPGWRAGRAAQSCRKRRRCLQQGGAGRQHHVDRAEQHLAKSLASSPRPCGWCSKEIQNKPKNRENRYFLGYNTSFTAGEVDEWLKSHAWKACVGKTYRGFESLPLRQNTNKPLIFNKINGLFFLYLPLPLAVTAAESPSL